MIQKQPPPQPHIDRQVIAAWFAKQFPNSTQKEVFESFRDLAHSSYTEAIANQPYNKSDFDKRILARFETMAWECALKNASSDYFYEHHIGVFLENLSKLKPQQTKVQQQPSRIPTQVQQITQQQVQQQMQRMPQQVQHMQQIPQQMATSQIHMPTHVQQVTYLAPQHISQPVMLQHSMQNMVAPPKQQQQNLVDPLQEVKIRFEKLKTEYLPPMLYWMKYLESQKRIPMPNNDPTKNERFEMLEKNLKGLKQFVSLIEQPDWTRIDVNILNSFEVQGKKCKEKILIIQKQRMEKEMKDKEEKSKQESQNKDVVEVVEVNQDKQDKEIKILEKGEVNVSTQGLVDRLSALEREKNDRLLKSLERLAQVLPTRGEKRKEFIALPMSFKKPKFESQYTFQSLQSDLNTFEMKKLNENLYEYQSKIVPKRLHLTINTNESIEGLFSISEYNTQTKQITSLQFHNRWTLSQCIQTYESYIAFLNQVEHQIAYLKKSSNFQYDIKIDSSLHRGEIQVVFEETGKIKLPSLVVTLNPDRIVNVTYDQVVPDEANRCFAQVRSKFEKLPWYNLNFLLNQWIKILDELYSAL